MCSSCVAHPLWQELHRRDSTIFPLLSPFLMLIKKTPLKGPWSELSVSFHNSHGQQQVWMLRKPMEMFFPPTSSLVVFVPVHLHVPRSSQNSLPTETVAFIQGLGRQTLTEEGRLCVFHTGISTWKLSSIPFKTVPQFSLCADFCLPRLLSYPPDPHSWLRVINTWFWNVILRRFVLFWDISVAFLLGCTHGAACVLLCAFVCGAD